jgi:hypothetical protein
VKEKVSDFERRTGERYAPPPWLRALGTPLGRRESCPTLFRFPGPEGLYAHLSGGLDALGPAGRGHVWLTSRPTGAYPRPVSFFGTLALLRPLRLHPCRTHCFTHTRDNWVALDRRVTADEVAWVPPALARARVSFDRAPDAAAVRRLFGPAYDDESRRTLEALGRYLEELSELRRAGVPGPIGHWCAIPTAQRRAFLAQHGLRPRWTKP